MPPLLEVDRVSKSFGGVAANVEISFDVREGEILGLIGPNGAGKTSLFNSISGEVEPDAGEVRLSGRRISGLRPRVPVPLHGASTSTRSNWPLCRLIHGSVSPVFGRVWIRRPLPIAPTCSRPRTAGIGSSRLMPG